mmetsp:Transcript_3104/g.4746  ORF Transcript_3104/g.4746 Transcript_3104/m.4746 type:complete len:1121 (-) Transcript_3104:235-3597(-)
MLVKPTLNVIAHLSGHVYGITSLAVNHVKKQILSCDGHTLRLFSLREEIKRILLPKSEVIAGLQYSESNDVYFALCNGIDVRIYSGLLEKLQDFNAHQRPALCTGFHEKRQELVTAGVDGVLKIWTCSKKKMWHEGRIITKIDCSVRLSVQNDKRWITSVHIDEHADRIFAAVECDVLIWHHGTGELLFKLSNLHFLLISAVVFCHSNKYLITASNDKGIKIWDFLNGRITQLDSLTGHTRRVNDIAFEPESGIMFSSSDDGSIRIWHVDKGEELNYVQLGPAASITAGLTTTGSSGGSSQQASRANLRASMGSLPRGGEEPQSESGSQGMHTRLSTMPTLLRILYEEDKQSGVGRKLLIAATGSLITVLEIADCLKSFAQCSDNVLCMQVAKCVEGVANISDATTKPCSPSPPPVLGSPSTKTQGKCLQDGVLVLAMDNTLQVIDARWGHISTIITPSGKKESHRTEGTHHRSTASLNAGSKNCAPVSEILCCGYHETEDFIALGWSNGTIDVLNFRNGSATRTLADKDLTSPITALHVDECVPIPTQPPPSTQGNDNVNNRRRSTLSVPQILLQTRGTPNTTTNHTHLIVGTSDGNVIVWAMNGTGLGRDWSHVRSWQAHSAAINYIFHTNSPHCLVISACDGQVKVFDPVHHQLQSHFTPLQLSCMMPIGDQTVLCGCEDGTVEAWECGVEQDNMLPVSDSAISSPQPVATPSVPRWLSKAHNGTVTSMALGHVPLSFVSSGEDGSVCMWVYGPIGAWSVRWSFSFTRPVRRACVLNPEGDVLAAVEHELLVVRGSAFVGSTGLLPPSSSGGGFLSSSSPSPPLDQSNEEDDPSLASFLYDISPRLPPSSQSPSSGHMSPSPTTTNSNLLRPTMEASPSMRMRDRRGPSMVSEHGGGASQIRLLQTSPSFFVPSPTRASRPWPRDKYRTPSQQLPSSPSVRQSMPSLSTSAIGSSEAPPSLARIASVSVSLPGNELRQLLIQNTPNIPPLPPPPPVVVVAVPPPTTVVADDDHNHLHYFFSPMDHNRNIIEKVLGPSPRTATTSMTTPLAVPRPSPTAAIQASRSPFSSSSSTSGVAGKRRVMGRRRRWEPKQLGVVPQELDPLAQEIQVQPAINRG